MRTSLRSILPAITAYLVLRHADEWKLRGQVLATYLVKPRGGAWVFLRTRQLGPLRLASARVLLKAPSSSQGWHDLKRELARRARTAPASAKYKYLFVPPQSVDAARSHFLRSAIEVLSNPSLQRTAALRASAAELMIR